MTRSKVKLQLFEKPSDRKVSFRKRKSGLLKKLNELCILCGVDGCAIISNPFESSIEIWPSPVGVEMVLNRFRQMPETEKAKHMLDQQTLAQERLGKLREQLRKLSMENKRMEIDEIVNQCLLIGGTLNFQNNPNLLNNMDLVLHQDIQEINIRIKTIKGENLNSAQGIFMAHQPQENTTNHG